MNINYKKWENNRITTTTTKPKNNKMKTIEWKLQKMKLQFFKNSKNGKYAMELTFSAQVGVEVRSSNLHMARAREIPYWPRKTK